MKDHATDGRKPADSRTPGRAYVECAHCGNSAYARDATCPYCGYRLVPAERIIWGGQA